MLVAPPTFGLYNEDDQVERKKPVSLIWVILAALAGVSLAGTAYVFLHPRQPAPAPAHVQQPAATPDAGQTTPAPADASPAAPATPAPAQAQPATKPAAGQPAGQSNGGPAPIPAQPRGVSPDEMNAQLAAASRIGSDLKKPVQKEEAPPAGFTPGAMSTGGSLPGSAFAQHGVQVQPGPMAISAGVASGMLVQKTEPVYPKIAKDARVSGTVVIAATITKTGALAGLHVISGPPMLVTAALGAVRTWRYRPYLLDNQPIEVQTTIQVVFNLGK